ncbi:hypothetical protein CDQ84_05745 [Clostridium thermosuccinogenes]|uniref:Uncharacterized protein n=1 Tax=Clostridium thermosuccinogenes TaxID=84032 RepID=A0A2K2FP78_9CLOT|nr:hypothetical protein CDO33_10140 [Pseudoclostridium thermosuccinogenes]PNT92570.1 hypothetical protein CDQ83_03120 [Pseudoclostridium thermosuccinogenes]PNT94670.1 hypothetical protein CDQ85_17480 [Pseudoclostridium thermosuccinogenes]PNU00586.1 hypothetical protein CDQ84_05745 [Pseudoclostridium thermosuccinogenes]
MITCHEKIYTTHGVPYTIALRVPGAVFFLFMLIHNQLSRVYLLKLVNFGYEIIKIRCFYIKYGVK